MVKTIIKEFIIFLLLLVSIALLLCVLFYGYIPTTKMVPAKIQVQPLPKEIQDELNSSISQGEGGYTPIVPPYTVDSIDLRNYESSRQYDKGKINPFEKYVPPPPPAPPDGNNTNDNTTNNNNTGNNSNNNVGNFYDGK